MIRTKKIDIAATLSLLTSILAGSTVPLFLKYFTSYIDNWTANGIRYPFSALLYLPWLLIARKRGALTRRMWKLALAPTIINIFGQILWAWTPYYIDPGLMSLLFRLSTLWAVLGSFIMFKDERHLIYSKNFWLGFLFAAGGFLAIILGGKQTFNRTTIIGIIMISLSSICWAGYQLFVRRNLSSVDSRTSFGMVSVMTSIGLIVGMFSFGKPEQALQMPVGITILVIVSGFIGVAAAHLLLYFALKRIGVAICSTANLASPFLTVFLSHLLFKETLTLSQWIAGLIFILGGFLLTQAQVDLRKLN